MTGRVLPCLWEPSGRMHPGEQWCDVHQHLSTVSAVEGRAPSSVEALVEHLAEVVDGFTPYERDSDASGTPPSFYLRDGSGQVFQVSVTAFTCRVCGAVLSHARSALGLTLCSGACHKASRQPRSRDDRGG